MSPQDLKKPPFSDAGYATAPFGDGGFLGTASESFCFAASSVHTASADDLVFGRAAHRGGRR